MREPRGLRGAISFLTRIPVDRGGTTPGPWLVSIPWFPLVGAIVGSATGLAYGGARVLVPSPVAATLAVGFGVVLTGALHEDGLADTADALGGGGTREDALRILKDPGHGTYGVLAIVLSVALRVAALSSLTAWAAVGAMATAHAMSRSAAVSLLGVTRPAVDEGLGASYARAVTDRQLVACIAAALTIGSLLLGIWVLPAATLSMAAAAAIRRVSVRRVGGVTGDILGAAQQVTEILILLLAVAVVTKGWGAIPWWRA